MRPTRIRVLRYEEIISTSVPFIFDAQYFWAGTTWKYCRKNIALYLGNAVHEWKDSKHISWRWYDLFPVYNSMCVVFCNRCMSSMSWYRWTVLARYGYSAMYEMLWKWKVCNMFWSWHFINELYNFKIWRYYWLWWTWKLLCE